MTLKIRINDDVKAAMRAGDARRRDALRLLLAALKQREVDDRKELADADVVAIIDKMIKQRRDSITQFEAGKREDLAAAERAEVTLLGTYLPTQVSESEIDAAIAEAITATGAAGPAGIGKVMAVVKPKLAGRADMAVVASRIKARLAG